jgi:hypothetical protein
VTHRLDKVKIEAALKRRGWRVGVYGEWEAPIDSTKKQREQDWSESVLEGVICDVEQVARAKGKTQAVSD